MALTDLLRSLDQDAARELEQTLAEQQHEAAAVLADAEEQAAAAMAEAKRTALALAERSATITLAEARAQARVCRDQALHEELEAMRSAAQTRLAEMVGTHSGRTATRALLTEALRLLPTATRVRVDPAHRETVDGTGLEVVEEQFGLGVVVEDDAGRAVDNTAGVRLQNRWSVERRALARIWRDDAERDDAGRDRDRPGPA